MGSLIFPESKYGQSERSEVVSVQICEAMASDLKKLCKVTNKNRSQTIRFCIEQVLLEAFKQGKIK